MSVITNNPLGPGFPATGGGFDFERSNGNALATVLGSNPRIRSDNVRLGPPGLGALLPGGLAGSAATSDQSGAGGVFAAFLSSLTNLFSQLLALVSSANLTSQTQPPSQPQQNSGERAFSDATASSVGDPHESFDGSSSAGTNVRGRWDSMTSHQNLLSSDSFAGGYRVATTATSPNSNGVTLNARADVATDAGRTNVGMNADGSYDVTSFGSHVDLVQGRAVHLNADETVTLNADRSLTIDERNAAGGTLATTLRSNGSGGVDLSSSAHNVDLGGYLVSKNDADADPVALAAGSGSRSGIEPIYAGYVPDAYATMSRTASPFAPSLPAAGTLRGSRTEPRRRSERRPRYVPANRQL
jgi:hypothetical protein